MNDFNFQYPWQETKPEDRLLEQLKSELSDGHVLYGKQPELIARRLDMDDILIKVDGKYAVVHLTWKPPTDPKFPFTTFYNSIEEAIEDE